MKDRLAVPGMNLGQSDIGDRRYYSWNCLLYADKAESDSWILIKLGHVHDGSGEYLVVLLPGQQIPI
ncbi:MAG: hypothetical protein JJE12_05535 [Anaerolineales bacterium]|nr:hypothetical protein [Anaerolineales bacterium]